VRCDGEATLYWQNDDFEPTSTAICAYEKPYLVNEPQCGVRGTVVDWNWKPTAFASCVASVPDTQLPVIARYPCPVIK